MGDNLLLKRQVDEVQQGRPWWKLGDQSIQDLMQDIGGKNLAHDMRDSDMLVRHVDASVDHG